MPSHRGAIEAMIAPDAPDRTVEKVAQLLNDVAPLASDLILSNWPTIFWAAPLKEMERLVVACSATVSGAASPSRLARFIRDALGLIHLDYDLLHPDRHLFMFTAREPLDAIAPVHALQVARPTTLDGWGNRRFCQALVPPAPLEPGCGMTIDIADGGVAVGAAEIVCTPVPMLHFECSYVGPVDRSDFGPDSDYLSFIRRGRDLQDLADYAPARGFPLNYDRQCGVVRDELRTLGSAAEAHGRTVDTMRNRNELFALDLCEIVFTRSRRLPIARLLAAALASWRDLEQRYGERLLASATDDVWHEGELLESNVTKTRDKRAELTLMKKALKRHGSPETITTHGNPNP